ncbi:Uncharacterised protein [Chlamydia trachomatis]|nr:Uncharacterised protein [Chlamydia trachomatis]
MPTFSNWCRCLLQWVFVRLWLLDVRSLLQLLDCALSAPEHKGFFKFLKKKAVSKKKQPFLSTKCLAFPIVKIVFL